MNKSDEKIRDTITEKRIKLHQFNPSKRKIWTVVGRTKEHWLYPEMNYCSCQGYYFGKLNNKPNCYHLDSIKIAINENGYELVEFSDDEFEDFISGLISEL